MSCLGVLHVISKRTNLIQKCYLLLNPPKNRSSLMFSPLVDPGDLPLTRSAPSTVILASRSRRSTVTSYHTPPSRGFLLRRMAGPTRTGAIKSKIVNAQKTKIRSLTRSRVESELEVLVLDRERGKVALSVVALSRVHQEAVADLGIAAELQRELEPELINKLGVATLRYRTSCSYTLSTCFGLGSTM